MSQHISLSDYLTILNQQIASQALLSEYLFQMDALFELALNSNFIYQKKTTVHYYLSVIDDIVNEAKDFNEKQLNYLIQLSSVIDKINPSSGGETVH